LNKMFKTSSKRYHKRKLNMWLQPLLCSGRRHNPKKTLREASNTMPAQAWRP
jgi:hypothetical protein